MRTVGRLAVVGVAIVGLVVFSHGCGDQPYVGLQCETTEDCQSQSQNVPGTGCVDGACRCIDPSHKICCARGEDRDNCFQACRPCSECVVGTEGCPMGCQSDAECPGPPDARCGVGRCVQGDCVLEINPGPLASQLRGDCQRLDCDVTGAVVPIADPSDFYDDGNQCTYDSCGPSGALNEPLPNGLACPVSGGGRCWEGACVDCAVADPNMDDCPPGFGCYETVCVPGHCFNFQTDTALGETDRDCGGPCHPCPPGDTCSTGTDCIDQICGGAVCRVPTCDDGVKNDAETGLDCGAPSCPLCGPGQGCETGADCSSGVCWAGVCEAPSCFDAVRNGEEAGVDCGPTCSVPCP